MRKIAIAMLLLGSLRAYGQLNCASFFPVDVFINMNGQTPGTTVTTTNLGAATEGTTSGWSQATTFETFAVSRVSFPYAVQVQGGTYHGCNYATQSLAFNAAGTLQNSKLDIGGSHGEIVASGVLSNLPPLNSGSGSFYDLMLLQGSNGNAAVLQLNNGNSGYCGGYGFGIEWSVLTERTTTCLKTGISAGMDVFYTMHANFTSTGTCAGLDGVVNAPCAEATFYTISGNQIGAKIGDAIAVATASATTTMATLWLGNNETASAAGSTYYFQDVMLDWTNHTYPNVPQYWAGVMASADGIDWTLSGIPGGIPTTRTQCGSTLNPSGGDDTTTIQNALNACGANKYVLLGIGTFPVTSVSVPSNTTLRGSGANQTVLNCTSTTSTGCVAMGSGGVAYSGQLSITGRSNKGSDHIILASTTGVSVGKYLAISELDNASLFVTINGGEGTCTWCSGWSTQQTRSRGQVVEVTGISGTTVAISPPLYTDYTLTPTAVPFTASVNHAGVENLQVYENNTGYTDNFDINQCAYCWLKGVEVNYTDGDYVQMSWSFRNEIRDSYFSNTFVSGPGSEDGDIFIEYKTSGALVTNNIIERAQAGIMFARGSAGNVASYNFITGIKYDAATTFIPGGVEAHGAHPQFNLLEGNVTPMFYWDQVWGSSSDNTHFRNWTKGTSRACGPYGSRGTVTCSDAKWLKQGAIGFQLAHWSTRFNMVGNVVGSSEQSALTPLAAMARYGTDTRNYGTLYGYTFGYGESADDGSGSGCSGGTAPCHSTDAYNTAMIHGDYSNITSALTWTTGVTHTLPASFYLAASPYGWRSLPFPSIGPDVSSLSGPGGHVSTTQANAAMVCYATIGGTDGGAGSPYTFNADTCYASVAGSNAGVIGGATVQGGKMIKQ